ncbi:MAG: alpha-L-fucosidase [bacterium]
MRKYCGSTLFVLFCFACSVGAAAPEEPQDQRNQRMAWWREARFGMVIHWGLYAVPAGVWNGKRVDGPGEWIMFRGRIPVVEYERLADQFNPPQFNPREWVSIAKNAGMKYILITAKHHDGFCLFDSKLTDFDVMNTPFHRDVLKELSDECHREGIQFGLYYSIMDWHHPDYLPRGKDSPRPWDTRPTEEADYNRYIEYVKDQLRELLTNYGDIAVLWFDGGWEHSAEENRATEIIHLARSIQPNIIINDRLGITQDFNTPEQYVPAKAIQENDWETCMTMNDTWGHKSYDQNWKSAENLIHSLVGCAAEGGNFLLNVGPTDGGIIPKPSVERLEAIGRWLKDNGESIYASAPSPFRELPWGRCTRKPGQLFLHVFNWPEGNLSVPGLRNPVLKAYLLTDSNRSPLALRRTEEEALVSLPEAAPDPIDTVIVLEIEGEPDVFLLPIHQREEGSLKLEAMDATIHGPNARYETGLDKGNIGFWTSPEDWVSWDFRIDKPGTFIAEITYACGKGAGGSKYEITVGDQKLKDRVEETDSWNDYARKSLRAIQLSTPGTYTLSVKAATIPSSAVMNLKRITLRPVDG